MGEGGIGEWERGGGVGERGWGRREYGDIGILGEVMGRNVVIEQSYVAPRVTIHGVMIAKAVEFNNKVKNIGATPMQQVVNATNDVAGDGNVQHMVQLVQQFLHALYFQKVASQMHRCIEEDLKKYKAHDLAPTHNVLSLSRHPLTGNWNTADLSSKNTKLKLLLLAMEQQPQLRDCGDAGREAHGGGETTSSGQTGSWVLQIPLMEMELAETVLVDRW
ncbi:chaperonin CPN60-2, mitochondrial-like protein [Tanacetum coccineum]